MMNRDCTNCLEETVDEKKQTFIYRDYVGNKWDACIRPVCDKCIEAGTYKEERPGIQRLYLGNSRIYKEEDTRYFWG